MGNPSYMVVYMPVSTATPGTKLPGTDPKPEARGYPLTFLTPGPMHSGGVSQEPGDVRVVFVQSNDKRDELEDEAKKRYHKKDNLGKIRAIGHGTVYSGP